MRKPGISSLAVLALGCSLGATPLLASAAETEKLKADIEALQAQNKEILERLDATAEMLESTTPGGHDGGDPMAKYKRSTHHGSSGRTTVGGYGELHYTNLTGKGGASDLKEMDFHRAVLFVGHEFNDRIRFFTEWDLEHASKIELEQAFLEFDISENTWMSTGVLLLPFGIINETHEPPTFYGVERNPVETYIIPSTWREGGAAVGGRFGKGWGYDVFLTSGMALDPADRFAVRKGRQFGGEAIANDLAGSARLKWNGLAGLELSMSYLYQANGGQGAANIGRTSLVSGHVSYASGGFQLRAVYAGWNIDGAGPASVGANKQTGWYIEPSYKFSPSFGIFGRYNIWDNQAGADTGSAADSKKTQYNIGANYWPIPDVVVKLDLQYQDNANGENRNGFLLGAGYQF
ncbi:MAG TPA: porin [Chromatiales bacterium]|nr:porin [Chromatiales bacterium]